MCENIKIDSREKALDYAIRDYECNEKSVGYGYEIAGNKYWNYLSNKSWEEFLKSMSSLHRAQYNDADGGELKVKQGRWGIYPPKMASFGSSSRFLYNISKNIECFQFEKLLPTRVGGSANLDGYITRGDGDVFVEAKCREIYSSHKTIEVSNVYEEIYKELQELYPKFSFKNNGRPIKNGKEDNEHFNCTFKFNGKEIIHFDIKQLICHFLAISANILENENANKNIKFIYLIFNPNEVIEQVEKESYKKQIIEIYGDIKKEITDYFDMELLFESIFEIQAKRLGLEGEKNSLFEFHLVDQYNYKEIIK